ncbi:MAG: hypothetical protein ABFC24_00185 [Methanoregulaceae archaeon]
MADTWIGYWVFVTAAIVAILVAFCILVLVLIRHERKFFRDRVLLSCYRDLFEGLECLHAVREDESGIASAKAHLIATLDRISTLTAPDVQIRVCDLLSLIDDYSCGEIDPDREEPVVRALVRAAGTSLDPAGIRILETMADDLYLSRRP